MRENGHVTEDVTNGERKVMSEGQRWSVYWRGNGHVKEVASLMEGEWFCYKGGLFNGGGKVMSERWPV